MTDWLPVSLLDWLMLGLVSLLVLLTLFGVLPRLWRGRPRQPYVQQLMFSPESAAALRLLEQAAGDRLRVFPSVQMSEVLTLAPDLKKAHRDAAWQALFGEKLDFVLCSPADLRVRLVVALVDDSLSRADDRHRHYLLEQLEAAGLPVIHLSPKDWPTVAALREEINGLLEQPVASPALGGGRHEPVLSLPADTEEDNDEPRLRL